MDYGMIDLESVQNDFFDSDDSASEGKVSLLQKIGAAGVGAFFTTVVSNPLDVLKTRIQANSIEKTIIVKEMQKNVFSSSRTDLILPRGLARNLTVIIKKEGFSGLYSGIGPALAGSLPSTVVYMVMYDETSTFLRPICGPFWAPLFSGGIARSCVTLIFNPLELLKTQAQAFPGTISNTKKHGLVSQLQQVISKEGPRGLWRGSTITLFRDVPFSMVYWFGYEHIAEHLRGIAFLSHHDQQEAAPGVAFVAGASSAVVATCLTMPFDVIKTRQQILPSMHGHKFSVRPSILSIGTTIFYEEGAKGLVRGLLPRALRVATASAVMISTYEGVKAFFQNIRANR